MDNIWNGLHDSSLGPQEADAVVLGLPFDGASSYRKGSAQAPERIRQVSGHISPTTEDGRLLAGLKVLDLGNLEQGTMSQADYFSLVQKEAAELFKSSFPTFIGGDHSVSIPLLQAAAGIWGEDLGVIHLDAHLDLCQELGGNKLSHGCTHRRAVENSALKLENICFIGIRSYEEQELDFIKDKEVNIISAADFYQQGPAKTALQVMHKLKACKAFYLTLDIDFLDPAAAPGTGTPKPGGPGARELFDLLQGFSSLNFIGMDVVEVSPPLDHSDITSFVAQRAITEAWGHYLK